ncbi:PucR family transcriptional regulator [Streptomyces sp. T028]|uniref:PucR family transcriptional regulator n=1 Tax=Streptomyces sp. T028 TaxID=3394379 RepID=UPI003A8B2DEE
MDIAILSAAPPVWVRRLKPQATHSATPQRHFTDDVETRNRVGEGAWRWAIEMGRRVATELARLHPEFALPGDPVRPAPTFLNGVQAGAVRVLLSVALNEQRGLMTRENQLANQEFVRMGIPLPTVLQAVRTGPTWFVDAFLEQIEIHAPADQRPAEMRRVVPIVLAAFTDFTTDMQERYLAERAQWATGVAANRRELIRQLVAGHSLDLAQASVTLDYALAGTHRAYILFCPDPPAPAVLQRAAAAFTTQLGTAPTLVVPVNEQEVWIWYAGEPAQPRPPAAARTGAPPIRVACGRPGPGSEGFRMSHLQALEAMRLARHDVAAPAEVDYADVEVVALLTANPELARRFVEDTLGELAQPTAEMREVRDTVACYLAENGSLVHAGNRLYVNRNTVAYRLSKAERLLGHHVKSRQLELRCALAVMQFLENEALTVHATVP